MASELRVDRIIPTSGVPTNGGGSILQVMPVYGLANTLTTSTTTSYASMGLSGTITPLRTDSKIYISINVMFGGDVDNDSQGYVAAGFNVRGCCRWQSQCYFYNGWQHGSIRSWWTIKI